MVHFFGRLTLGTFASFYIRKIQGKNNLPKSPFVVAANHASFIDDIILPTTIITLTKNYLHIFVNSRFYKNFFLRKFLFTYNCIPVDVRKDVHDEEKRKKTNEHAFKQALDALDKNQNFAIFPEGTRSKDGKLRKAKTGVAKVALEARVPVVPVGIKGSFAILPKGAKFLRFKRADVIIGKPMTFEKYYGKEDDYKVLEKVTTMIMKEIAKLTDQRYPE